MENTMNKVIFHKPFSEEPADAPDGMNVHFKYPNNWTVSVSVFRPGTCRVLAFSDNHAGEEKIIGATELTTFMNEVMARPST
jgi:hypothetical protein